MTLSQDQYANDDDSTLITNLKTQNWSTVQTILETSNATAKTQTQTTLCSTPDQNSNLALHVAIGLSPPIPILLRILSFNPSATRHYGANDWLPIHIGAMYGCETEVMEALIRDHPLGLDDVGQGGVKGRSPRHFSGRFEHNRMLLERSTADWMVILELDK